MAEAISRGAFPTYVPREQAKADGPSQGGYSQQGLVNAMEELTFQVSEVVEATQLALEQRFDVDMHALHDEEEASVEEVCAVLRLLEGRDLFDQLRGRARLFAKAFSEGRREAMDYLTDGLQPQHRWAVLRLATRAMADESANRLNAEAHALAMQYPAPLNSIFRALPAMRAAPPPRQRRHCLAWSATTASCWPASRRCAPCSMCWPKWAEPPMRPRR